MLCIRKARYKKKYCGAHWNNNVAQQMHLLREFVSAVLDVTADASLSAANKNQLYLIHPALPQQHV
jgi:hypothetical protein